MPYTNTDTNMTSTSGLSPQVRQNYRKDLLRRVTPKLVWGKDAKKDEIPTGEGRIANYRRFEPLPVNPTNALISEGNLPSPLIMSNTNVPVSVDQYGGYLLITDRSRKQSIDKMIPQATKLLGEHMMQTLDQLARNQFVQATSVRFANGRASLAALQSTDTINEQDIRKLFRDLQNQLAVPFDDVEGMPYYKCIIDPSVMYDLQDTPMWKNAAYYQTKDGKSGQVKILFGIWFVTTTTVPTQAAGSGGTVTSHTCFCYGQEFGVIMDIEGLDDTDLIIHLGENDKSVYNALELVSSIGWKTTFGAAILNQAFCTVYKCAATGA